jgi:uncharacterized membrane protein
MAFCANCGGPLNQGATFCGSCGAKVSSSLAQTGAAAAPAPAPVRSPVPSGAPSAAGTGLAPNVAGMLAYTPFVGWIIAVLWLVLDPYKNDPFIRFNALQELLFSVALIGLSIVFSIVGMIITAITSGFGGLVMLPIWGIFWLAVIAYKLYLMYRAYNNERPMIPFIGEFAAKQVG